MRFCVANYSDRVHPIFRFGRTRNQNIAAMFMDKAQHITTLKCITHILFLENGHSQMECDSMHVAIEHNKRYVDVFTMLDWISILRHDAM